MVIGDYDMFFMIKGLRYESILLPGKGKVHLVCS